MRKFIFLSIVLVLTLTSSVFADSLNNYGNVLNSNALPSKLSATDAAIKFRDIHGLDTNKDYMNYMFNHKDLESDFEKEFGFPLSIEEQSIINLRNDQLESSSILRDIIRERYSDIFGESRVFHE